MRFLTLLLAVITLASLTFVGITLFRDTPTIAVVDTASLFSQSAPAAAGNAHLQQVQTILQKSLNDLQQLYKGKENTPQARQAIAQGRAALEQKFAVEQQAVMTVLQALLQESVREWRTGQEKALVIIPAHGTLDSDATLDATKAVLQVYNTKKPAFAPLPSVTINLPREEPAPASPASKSNPKEVPKPTTRKR